MPKTGGSSAGPLGSTDAPGTELTTMDAGTLVWAKLPPYPWWPALISEDPDTGLIFTPPMPTKRITHVHVEFFGSPKTHACVEHAMVRKFIGEDKRSITKGDHVDDIKAYKIAVKEAVELIPQSIKARKEHILFVPKKRKKFEAIMTGKDGDPAHTPASGEPSEEYYVDSSPSSPTSVQDESKPGKRPVSRASSGQLSPSEVLGTRPRVRDEDAESTEHPWDGHDQEYEHRDNGEYAHAGEEQEEEDGEDARRGDVHTVHGDTQEQEEVQRVSAMQGVVMSREHPGWRKDTTPPVISASSSSTPDSKRGTQKRKQAQPKRFAQTEPYPLSLPVARARSPSPQPEPHYDDEPESDAEVADVTEMHREEEEEEEEEGSEATSAPLKRARMQQGGSTRVVSGSSSDVEIVSEHAVSPASSAPSDTKGKGKGKAKAKASEEDSDVIVIPSPSPPPRRNAAAIAAAVMDTRGAGRGFGASKAAQSTAATAGAAKKQQPQPPQQQQQPQQEKKRVIVKKRVMESSSSSSEYEEESSASSDEDEDTVVVVGKKSARKPPAKAAKEANSQEEEDEGEEEGEEDEEETAGADGAGEGKGDGDGAASAGHNDDFCFACKKPGDILLCDTCTHAYHYRCLKTDEEIADGFWACPPCRGAYTCYICHDMTVQALMPKSLPKHLAYCDHCERYMHRACLPDGHPDNYTSKRWACPDCTFFGAASKVETILAHRPKDYKKSIAAAAAMKAAAAVAAGGGSGDDGKGKGKSDGDGDGDGEKTFSVTTSDPTSKRNHHQPDPEDAKMEGDDEADDLAFISKPRVYRYCCKWEEKSHLHNQWVPDVWLERVAMRKLKAYQQKQGFDANGLCDMTFDMSDVVPDSWKEIHRLLSYKKEQNIPLFFVKWRGLGYEQCTWETRLKLMDLPHFQSALQALKLRRDPPAQKRTTLQQRKNEYHELNSQPPFLTHGTLFPYQIEGLNWLTYSWHNSTNVILADEMGLGKTVQAISFLTWLHQIHGRTRFLVVAPLSTTPNWGRELDDWAPSLNTVVFTGYEAARKIICDYELFYNKKPLFNVVVTSYELLMAETNVFSKVSWDCIIVDEGHRLKSKTSKLFTILNKYTTEFKILLTGTPLQNNLTELYNLLEFLDRTKFRNRWEHKEADELTKEDIAMLREDLKPHLLRRVKADVFKDMPAKVEVLVPCGLSTVQKQMYRALLEKNMSTLVASKNKSKVQLQNLIMQLRKCSNHPYLFEGAEPEKFKSQAEMVTRMIESSGKLLLLDKMLVKLKAEGHRVIIFSQMTRLLDIIEDYLAYRGYGACRLDGSVNIQDRQRAIEKFTEKGSDKFVFLLSTRAGGLGLNLTQANTIIIFDCDWNPHMDMQAMSRAHRIGQTQKVMVYKFVTRNTIEERMLEVAKQKLLLDHAIVENMQQDMNVNELEEILKFGAKQIFEDTSEESLVYDDDMVDRLLDRENNEFETKTDEAGASDSGLFSSFKVADVGRAQNGGSVDDPDFWTNLLRERVEANEAVAAEAAAASTRGNRRTVAARGGYKDKWEVDSLDELEDSQPQAGRGRGRPRKGMRVDESAGAKGGQDDEEDYGHVAQSSPAAGMERDDDWGPPSGSGDSEEEEEEDEFVPDGDAMRSELQSLKKDTLEADKNKPVPRPDPVPSMFEMYRDSFVEKGLQAAPGADRSALMMQAGLQWRTLAQEEKEALAKHRRTLSNAYQRNMARYLRYMRATGQPVEDIRQRRASTKGDTTSKQGQGQGARGKKDAKDQQQQQQQQPAKVQVLDPVLTPQQPKQQAQTPQQVPAFSYPVSNLEAEVNMVTNPHELMIMEERLRVVLECKRQRLVMLRDVLNKQQQQQQGGKQ